LPRDNVSQGDPPAVVRGRVIETAIVGAFESVALELVLVLPPAVAPNSISCLLTKHRRLGLCDVDGDRSASAFVPDSHAARKGCVASLLRGGDPITTIHSWRVWSASATSSAQAIAAGRAVRRQQPQFLVVAQCPHGQPGRGGQFADPDLCYDWDGKASRNVRCKLVSRRRYLVAGGAG